jgi:ketosteroid isomerase-like protein
MPAGTRFGYYRHPQIMLIRLVNPHTSEDDMVNGIDVRTSADQILTLERGALDRWGRGDPGGFLESYAADITYFDPVTATRIDGHQAMADYYVPWVGKIQIARYEMLNPHVVVDGNVALLTYNLVNYIRDAQGVESVGSRWNSTTVYQQRESTWKAIHSHWSFTRHPAFQNMTAEASEGLETPAGQRRSF